MKIAKAVLKNAANKRDCGIFYLLFLWHFKAFFGI